MKDSLLILHAESLYSPISFSCLLVVVLKMICSKGRALQSGAGSEDILYTDVKKFLTETFQLPTASQPRPSPVSELKQTHRTDWRPEACVV